MFQDLYNSCATFSDTQTLGGGVKLPQEAFLGVVTANFEQLRHPFSLRLHRMIGRSTEATENSVQPMGSNATFRGGGGTFSLPALPCVSGTRWDQNVPFAVHSKA